MAHTDRGSLATHIVMIEIVIAARNDDYSGPDFVDRLCATASYNHELLLRASVAHSFTLVEWNPITGRRYLSELVAENLPWWGRFLIIDPEWHRRLSTNPRLQFMEFFAKNVAIRRSTAEAILTTNSDVFLSPQVVESIAAAELRDWAVYRAERVDIDRRVEWRSPGEDVFGSPAHQIRVNEVTGPWYSNAAGDFLLLTRKSYHELRGFNEAVRYSKIHKDGQFCYKAWLEGLSFKVLGRVWHIEHEGTYATMRDRLAASDTAPYGPEWDWQKNYSNPRYWGLSGAIPVQSDQKTEYLHHPSTHGPLLSVVSTGGLPASTASFPPDVEIITVEGEGNLVRAINEALAHCHGRFLGVAGLGWALGLAEGLGPCLAETDADLIAGDSDVIEHPLLGTIPSPGSGFIFSRRAYETVGEWEEGQTDAALSLWLQAREYGKILRIPGSLGRTPELSGAWPSAALTARTLLQRGQPHCPPQLIAQATDEWAAAVSGFRDCVHLWVRSLIEGRDAVCGILGVHCATPILREGVQMSGAAFAGIFSIDALEVGTHVWGSDVSPLDLIPRLGVTDLLGLSVSDRELSLLRDAGYKGTVHAMWPGAREGSTLRFPSELDLLRRDQGKSIANQDCAAILRRLPRLAAIEGPHHWGAIYEAAMCLDRAGLTEEALRLFRRVASPRNEDLSVRIRAIYHLGRLFFERGDDTRALPLLDRVLRHIPAHRKAWEHWVSIIERSDNCDRAMARSTATLRRRWRQRQTAVRVNTKGNDAR